MTNLTVTMPTYANTSTMHSYVDTSLSTKEVFRVGVASILLLTGTSSACSDEWIKLKEEKNTLQIFNAMDEQGKSNENRYKFIYNRSKNPNISQELMEYTVGNGESSSAQVLFLNSNPGVVAPMDDLKDMNFKPIDFKKFDGNIKFIGSISDTLLEFDDYEIEEDEIELLNGPVFSKPFVGEVKKVNSISKRFEI
ncbi:hypothetical protein NMG90_17845 [Bacillus mycoides]|uniref:hypothetical protein n=1 Tax=Bacillus mycoides TaxID=1405 RepID=UPI0009945FB9|nr:hypothetical protein [Bacillus mycoides]MCP9227267.1 hypothetical protein [Bacillus mycoides]OOR67510.1 hypothetical protein BLW98_16105 [Bacillus mycoides]OOR67568.1 hypothetical protein BLW98_16415 [Bacillus mycoides]